jgi:two-component system OmpR family response regulator
MSVTAISDHTAIPASRRAPYPHRTVQAGLTSSAPARLRPLGRGGGGLGKPERGGELDEPHASPRDLTVTLQITVSGAALPTLATRVIEDIREFATRLPGATVLELPVGESTVDPLSVREAGAADGESATGPRLYIEPASRTVLRDGEPVRLTRREFDLLLFLSENRRRVFSREQLLTRVWGYEWVGGSRTVDVHIRRLRVKLGQQGPVVCTVHGVGYRLDDEVQVTVDHDVA